MSWVLRVEDLPDLARGAAVLGTGGGGDPYIGRLMVARAMQAGDATITGLGLDDLDPAALVVPTAMMGAPTVMVEKLPRGDEAVNALRALEKHLGRRADATMPIECGGLNSMIPLVVAARTGLPVVDADGMGRAFPELNMETFGVYGVAGSPMVVAGENGETSIIDTGSDNRRMEWLSRGLAIRMGGAAHIAEYPMSGADVRRTAIGGTLSLGLRIGRALREARTDHVDPATALAETLADTLYRHVRQLFVGKVVDIDRRTVDGFVRGHAVLTSFTGDSRLDLDFQNEHLLARVDGAVRAVVPDLVCMLEVDTGDPVTTEGMRYGQRVRVVGISTPDIMRTPAALSTFGPQAFGIDSPFVAVEELNHG